MEKSQNVGTKSAFTPKINLQISQMFYRKHFDVHTHTKETLFILEMLELEKENTLSSFVSDNDRRHSIVLAKGATYFSY